MLRRHHRGDGVAFSVRSCVEHNGGCIPVHSESRLAVYGLKGHGAVAWAHLPSVAANFTCHCERSEAIPIPLGTAIEIAARFAPRNDMNTRTIRSTPDCTACAIPSDARTPARSTRPHE
jgi:hypothetical protein